ncbi:MAG: hypothetical protein ACOYN3_06540 [Acidimicrobiia bacterium]
MLPVGTPREYAGPGIVAAHAEDLIHAQAAVVEADCELEECSPARVTGDASVYRTRNGSMSALTRLIGVYDADSTFRGEVIYWIGARLGRQHCALCDITHGVFRERSDWQACRAELPVPFDTYHRNDMPSAVRELGLVLPAVVAETNAGLAVVLDAEALTACGGDPQALVDAIQSQLIALGITRDGIPT